MKHAALATLWLALILPVSAAAQQASTSVAQPGAAPQAPHPPHPPTPTAGRDLGKWWKNSEVVRELELTPAQISQIETTFLEHRLKLIDLRADLERQETRLQPLVEADQPDEAKVGAQIDSVVAARGRLEKANTMMMLAIRRVLTVDQWKKLQSMQEHRMTRPMAPHPARQHHEPEGPHAPKPPRPPDEDGLNPGRAIAPAPAPESVR